MNGNLNFISALFNGDKLEVFKPTCAIRQGGTGRSSFTFTLPVLVNSRGRLVPLKIDMLGSMRWEDMSTFK
jgi:hypothetical protein